MNGAAAFLFYITIKFIQWYELFLMYLKYTTGNENCDCN